MGLLTGIGLGYIGLAAAATAQQEFAVMTAALLGAVITVMAIASTRTGPIDAEAASTMAPVVRNLDARRTTDDRGWPVSADEQHGGVVLLTPSLVRCLLERPLVDSGSTRRASTFEGATGIDSSAVESSAMQSDSTETEIEEVPVLPQRDPGAVSRSSAAA
jgi:hypothetical protein